MDAGSLLGMQLAQAMQASMGNTKGFESRIQGAVDTAYGAEDELAQVPTLSELRVKRHLLHCLFAIYICSEAGFLE